MTTIEIARRMAELGNTAEAVRAFTLVANGEGTPEERMEAAVYILQSGGDYKISYSTFVRLHGEGWFRSDIETIMTQAFYEPNVKPLKNRYAQNIKLLKQYPYLFCKDFPAFEALPLRFIPFGDHGGYVPFDRRTGEFWEFVNPKNTVVSRNFFSDLEKPVLADDVFSQYELEYLNDNVRPSEWVGRENHIYLHYTDWTEFCAWLQVLSMKPLLSQKKIVFLIGDELTQYPIDFKERYGIDYGKFPVRPIGVHEVTRMIWHTQLSSHNGGDFFNEILDAHPNLIYMPSVMMEKIEASIKEIQEMLGRLTSPSDVLQALRKWDNQTVAKDFSEIKNPSVKDILVALYLENGECAHFLDPGARIAPALFFQPHFPNLHYMLYVDESGAAVLSEKSMDALPNSNIFREFKYIKTFTPVRRFTTSHGATVKFMMNNAIQSWSDKNRQDSALPDAISERILNRSFMRDPEDRLYRDSIIVRFEDAKLNPRATFAALAEFLDIPYAESMTYCSLKGEHDPVTFEDQAIGFDTSAVYRTYDEFVNDNERYYIEYFLRDAYVFYGYDFLFYDGAPLDEERVKELITGFTTIEKLLLETWENATASIMVKHKELIDLIRSSGAEGEASIPQKEGDTYLDDWFLDQFRENWLNNAKILLKGLRFVNKRGQPLEMTPMLQPDPALLEQPLYH